jgi:hypothetical protein
MCVKQGEHRNMGQFLQPNLDLDLKLREKGDLFDFEPQEKPGGGSFGSETRSLNLQGKGDALYAMELSLSLEKLNFQKLRQLHAVAAAAEDAQMCDFVEGQLLEEQARAVKEVSEYVAQLRRVGKGLGVFEFDRWLSEKKEAAA